MQTSAEQRAFKENIQEIKVENFKKEIIKIFGLEPKVEPEHVKILVEVDQALNTLLEGL